MAYLCALRAAALLQVSFLVVVSSDSSTDHPASFLARGRQDPAMRPMLVRHGSGAGAPAPAAAPAAAVATPVAAATPGGDCAGTCAEAKKMWQEAKEAQDLAIALQANQTADRINAETDLIVQDVKMKVRTDGLTSVNLMKDQIDTYLNGRVKAFSDAVGSRHEQVVAGKAKQFTALKQHQGKLMEAMMADVIDHGYEVAKSAVASEAAAAGASFNSNVKVKGALKQVKLAGDSWDKTFETSQQAALQGYGAWNTAYHGLQDPWNNVMGSFSKANAAALAARGLGPDTRWALQMVRVSGEATQAGNTEIKTASGHVDLALSMANRVAAKVAGNSGSIVTLKLMLDNAENVANQAAMAR